MNLSIVIPTLNEAANLALAIRSAWEAGAAEVIVVDGGSQDATTEVAAECPCQFVRGPRGRGPQQNLGAERATGDVLLFLHADNRLPPQAADQIAEALKDPRCPGGAFRQRIEAEGVAFRLLERGNALRTGWLGRPYGDQGIFLRREIFRRAGGFPDVPLMEDVLLMKRVRRLGRPCLLEGPLSVSPRRWRRHGVVRQTVRNWSLLLALRLGASPQRLAAFYPAADVMDASIPPDVRERTSANPPGADNLDSERP